jgi:hypothetical protein
MKVDIRRMKTVRDSLIRNIRYTEHGEERLSDPLEELTK